MRLRDEITNGLWTIAAALFALAALVRALRIFHII